MSTKTLSLRPATEDDIAQVAKIEKVVHVAPWSEESFRSELTKPYSQFLVFTDDETDSEICGYIVFWIMLDECQILNVAVDLPSRGLGLAKQMIRKAALLAYQNGIRKMVLDVRKSNLSAIHLYQSLRFAITHIRKNFYANGEDAYSMVLFLDGDPLAFSND